MSALPIIAKVRVGGFGLGVTGFTLRVTRF